ncbi:hypothetical protein DPMN_091626 [Dreissena polymorpha]|uniref:Uncharacterized protein n=1 Tax=Dreissena polymorpha TaxID=45954 RepID=A0A9D4KZW3_DREPO|nr:hypothetical protein DPMN_091626 [Dreissena polymorpha]
MSLHGKKVVPRNQRRFSLPNTPTQPLLGFIRAIPEGSGDYQKALEELYANEPNHAPKQKASSIEHFGFNGLNNIQELNESDGDDDNNDGIFETRVSRPQGRRHSSPCFLESNHRDDTHSNENKQSVQTDKLTNVMTQHHKLRKEYFMKHGHWPFSNGNHLTPKSKSSGAKRT